MAHYIDIVEGLNQEVGMSTRISYEAGKILVEWKRGERRVINANVGDRLQVTTGGGFPEVRIMRPPKGELEKAAWRYRFFGKQRVETLAELEKRAAAETIYSRPRGYDIPGAAVFRGEKCAVVYKAAMEGQRGIPFLWYAEPTADPAELQRIIEQALGCSAIHLYS